MLVSIANRLLLVSLVLYFTRLRAGQAQSRYAPCDSPIYCYGDLLDAVQRAGIFNDSKEYVDRPLVADVSEVLDAFSRLPVNMSSSDLREFVLNWTTAAGSDIEPWIPTDWTPRPSFIDTIESSAFQEWAVQLNAIWRELGRQVNQSVSEFPDRHSLIPVPHPFIVPGGRFREFYYWDSYWIVRGLLLCNMTETAKNMILNMVSMVERYGFVPNGGRVYYTRRSQPPLLTQTVDVYVTTTGDVDLLESILPVLFTEYEFWIENRTVTYVVDDYVRYGPELDVPRPESYREDLNTASNSNDTDLLYSDLAAGAESGWDFSSRWLLTDSLSSIRTLGIIPVDLNAIICQNEATLAKFYRLIGNDTMADLFDNTLLQRQASFDKLFWNESSGLWRDMDVDRMAHLEGFYASSLVPLLWNCTYPNSSSTQLHLSQQKATLSYLRTQGLLDYIGGIPTSLDRSSEQQWDFPNAWAPLQWFPVLAWINSSDTELRGAARSIAATWLNSTYEGWRKYNTMFEKYDCRELGEPGTGGEYTTQSGFGWTNSVILDFLSLYPNATFNTSSPPTSDNTSTSTTTTPPSSPSTPAPTRPSISITTSTLPTVTPPPPTSTLPQRRSLGWVAAVVLLVVIVAIAIPCVLWCVWCYRSGETRYWARVRNEHLVAAGGGGSGTAGRERDRTSPTVYSNEYADDFSDSSWDV